MITKGLFPARGFPAPPAPVEDRASPENPRTSLSNPDAWLYNAFGANKNVSGVAVNERTALSVLAVFACIRIISEAVASLPLITYRRLERGKARAPEHPLYFLLHDRPNPEMSAMTFRETLQAHLLSYGNAFAEIETNKAGAVIGLWPLLPDRTWAERRDGQRVYFTVLPDGTKTALSTDRVFHIPGLGFDGLSGYSPVQMAKQSIGLTAATEEFGAAFFGRGSTTSGVLEHPGKLSDPARAHLRDSWNTLQSGLSGAHRIAILEEGMKWNPTSIPNNHAQFLETRKFQVSEIARMFRVPPHMLADLESGASYASVEQMSLDFVTYTLRPWLIRWEQAINYDLFGARERATMYAEHLVDGLLRGDLKSRYDAYAIGRNWGWLSANDVLEIENRNPLPGDLGDIYLVPSNMMAADKVKDAPAPGAAAPTAPADPAADIQPDTQRTAFVSLLRDVGERMVRREVPQLRKALKQGEAGWTHGVEGVYRDHIEHFAKALQPVFDALLSFGPPEARRLTKAARALALELAGIELTASRTELDGAGFSGAEALLVKWESDRAASFAERGADFMQDLIQTERRRVA